ncbi:MAG: sodium:calcium antiporter [Nitrospirae bacterium]|nr:sodium:calcium antiporter [Nitrospirota bacterium]
MSGLLFLGLLIILGGSYLFTNGVEWIGKRLRLSEGVVGSVLAGVGTAMPETMVPVIAIFFGDGETRQGVGIGAILGAPFMLTGLALPLLGLGVLFFSSIGRRTTEISLNAPLVKMDLGFFLTSYGMALLMAWLPVGESGRWIHYAAAAILIGLYLFYLRRLLVKEGTVGEDLEPLILSRGRTRTRDHPPMALILTQTALGFGLVVSGAYLFVEGMQRLSQTFGVSPLILSLIITPIATELPETFNSFIWIAQRKDTLAVANITGAMVFQSTFPVGVGLIGTPWQLDRLGLASAVLALLAAFVLYNLVRFRGRWRPVHLIFCLSLYVAYILYVFG